ncbi:hypothetical protein B9J07_13600 [Sinorhizobium sp. LM21]|nr:hypothetical protein B9J07_13600 [Sinorhizobium sp. LM21]
MTRQEMRSLFEGITLPTVQAAFRVNGNADLYERLWETDDPDEFFVRLATFSASLGLTAKRWFHPDCETDELVARIARDVDVVSQRIAYRWLLGREAARGEA